MKREISLEDYVREYLPRGNTKLVVLDRSIVQVRDSSTGALLAFFTIGSVDSFERRLSEASQRDEMMHPSISYKKSFDLLSPLVSVFPSLVTVWILWGLYRASRGAFQGGSGSGLFGGIGKSRARIYTQDVHPPKVRLSDVAGMDEAREEVVEFIRFLKEPKVFEKLGARIPRGAILAGVPGTGKTLLAKAIAGEAGVPFLSVSGSEFVEMFVGVGSMRVRDLFEEARQHAPCIVFIDEIDAIGRSRTKSSIVGAGNDERESTLNQLLVEMDGFEEHGKVIVLAGTNRLDVLDPALTRPGRFDRIIVIDKPDLIGREAIFKVHLRPLQLVDLIDSVASRLAKLTPGMTGADIANVCNEGALLAARLNASRVSLEHLESAIERVLAGIEKKTRVLSADERNRVAVHEAGHAILGWYLEHADPLLKVSIVPRGAAALGYAQYLPNETPLLTKEHLHDRVCMALGGRLAEELCLGTISTGARDDLLKVTAMIYAQVKQFGMGQKSLGALSFKEPGEEATQIIETNRPYSEETAREIDQEAREMLETEMSRARLILMNHLTKVRQVADKLLEREVLSRKDIEEILGPRSFTDK